MAAIAETSPTAATDGAAPAMVPGPETCSAFHCEEPICCQRYHRLPSALVAAIAETVPTWATDGAAPATRPGPETCSGFHCEEPMGCQ